MSEQTGTVESQNEAPPVNGKDTEPTPAPTEPQNTLSNMTQEQINAIPDEALRVQVQALFDHNRQLAAKVKEKDPTWIELAPYGKGTAGIKVSESGAIQITGTRKAYGGLYLFRKELVFLYEQQPKIIKFMIDNDDVIKGRMAVAEAKRAAEEKEKKNKKK